MTFDICFVTHNSEKWIEGCIESFAKSNYDLSKITLIFTDNASTDNTVLKLNQLKEKYHSVFNDFIIIKSESNFGFGRGSNISAKAGKGDIVFFCNVDTEIDNNAFNEVKNAIEENPNFDAFELRQFPYEHPKFYDPITLEVGFASGACFLLKRDLFEQTGGFDESIFMYAEDVDLSFRIRLLEKKIRYVPSAIIYHYSYATAGEEKPMQVAGSILGNYILRAKYMPNSGVKMWYTLKDNALNHHKDNPEVKRLFKRHFKDAEQYYKKYRKFYNNNVKNKEFHHVIDGFDYCFERGGAFYTNFLCENFSPLISVVIRTFKRPDILKLCLTTLTYQTYKNFEIIVCEDGENPQSEYVVNDYKEKLNIKYHAMKQNAGRCLTANKGMELANGDYFNLLDDDDYFYPEHLEVVVSNIFKHPECKMFVTGAIAIELDSDVKNIKSFLSTSMRSVIPEVVDLKNMLADNRMPIQAVTFHQSLPKKYGVFNNTFIEGLEDWELWTRYVSHEKCFVIKKSTSVYRIPADIDDRNRRAIALQKNIPLIREVFKDYRVTLEATEIFDVFYGENINKEHIDNMEALLGVRKTYVEIVDSRTWKFLNHFRCFFSNIWLFFNFCSIHSHKLNDAIWGPRKYLDTDNISMVDINNFIIQTQKSLAWKFVIRLLNKIK